MNQTFVPPSRNARVIDAGSQTSSNWIVKAPLLSAANCFAIASYRVRSASVAGATGAEAFAPLEFVISIPVLVCSTRAVVAVTCMGADCVGVGVITVGFGATVVVMTAACVVVVGGRGVG